MTNSKENFAKWPYKRFRDIEEKKEKGEKLSDVEKEALLWFNEESKKFIGNFIGIGEKTKELFANLASPMSEAARGNVDFSSIMPVIEINKKTSDAIAQAMNNTIELRDDLKIKPFLPNFEDPILQKKTKEDLEKIINKDQYEVDGYIEFEDFVYPEDIMLETAPVIEAVLSRTNEILEKISNENISANRKSDRSIKWDRGIQILILTVAIATLLFTIKI